MKVPARLFWIAMAMALVYWCSEDVDWMLHVLQSLQRRLLGHAVLDRLLFQIILSFHRFVDGVAFVAAIALQCAHLAAAWTDARFQSFVEGIPHAKGWLVNLVDNAVSENLAEVVNPFIETCFDAVLSTLQVLATYRAAVEAALKVVHYVTDAWPDMQWMRYFAITVVALLTVPGHVFSWAVQAYGWLCD